MKYEPYADKGKPTNYAVLELLAIGLLLAVLWSWKHTEHSWWNSFSLANQRFIQGVCLEAVGTAFLWLRVKSGVVVRLPALRTLGTFCLPLHSWSLESFVSSKLFSCGSDVRVLAR